MFKRLVQKVFGNKYDRDVKNISPIVDKINEIYEGLRNVSHDELRHKSIELRAHIANHLSDIDNEIKRLNEAAKNEPNIIVREDIFDEVDNLKKQRDEELEIVLEEILPEAFAVVKETARRFVENTSLKVKATDFDRELAVRPGKNHLTIEGDDAIWQNSWKAAGGDITWNMVHYDVQLIGGIVLHRGKVAEMMTGEGKTLVATLPAYLNGLAGQGVHIITVNDYLARRDSEWVGPIFEFLFLTVDCIDKYKPHSPERRRAYNSDITYGTNNEFGFDYLRDNMVRSIDERVQRKHHYAMIDEVDSVLIDDARTPLIISGPVPQGSEEQEYASLKPHIEKLITVQRQLATKFLSEAKSLFKDGIIGYQEGEAGMAVLRAYRALPKYRPLIKFLSVEGVKVMLQKAENYYMQEQSKHMHIADEPLFFTIDEKNRNVELTERGSEFLSKGNADPHFFILPDLAMDTMEIERNEEMTDVEKTQAKTKLFQDYAVKSKRLHSINQLLKAYTLFEKDEEYVVMDGEVKIVDEQTGRMMEGRRYSDGLHQALEAKENVKIGDITQTYATVTLQNYFRMFHKLSGMTGTAETEAGELWEIYKLDVVVIPTNKPVIRDDREDFIYKTEREKFNAVIDDIIRISGQGRPLLVGTTSVDISEKLSRMLQMKGIDHNVLNAKQHQREAEVVAEAGYPGKITIATNMAGRGTDIKLTDEVKKNGGLAIIGTERHDSRRVDRQLQGRAGRQGDPGSSQFYVSLEDSLMRLFQSERMAKMMDGLGHKEGDVIQHKWISGSIQKAQKKVEENNFGIRKRLLEYDDVMNVQREAIYHKRDVALSGERLAVELHNMFDSLLMNIVKEHKEFGNYESFRQDVLGQLGINPSIEAADFKEQSEEQIVDVFFEQFISFYHRKFNQLTDFLMPQIRDVYEHQREQYKRIVIPFTDGRSKPLTITAEIEKAVETNGKSIVTDIEKAVTLAVIDEKWKEHLRSMDELKDSSQAASFEQKDPLVVYKMEAFNLFEQLVHEINSEVTSYLSMGALDLPQSQGETRLRQARQQKTDMSKVRTSRNENPAKAAAEGVSRKPQETFKRAEKKVGRNDKCPCGSGKKYKHCHGR